MFKSKWIFLFIFSTLTLNSNASSYEASQVGISKDRLDKIVPVLESYSNKVKYQGGTKKFIREVIKKLPQE